MKFNYKFNHLCGTSYKCGNVLFTPDGNSMLSPVGNRITVFDLANHSSFTLPFEARKNIRRMALCPKGQLLVVTDIDGRGLLVNFPRRNILHRFNFKARVRALEFSPCGEYLAVTNGRLVYVWRTPGLGKEFSPLILHRKYAGHHEDVMSISWAKNSRYFVTSSKDASARIYSLNPEEDFTVVTLSGHRERLVNAFLVEKNDSPFSDNGKYSPEVYTVAKDGAVFIWEWTWNSINDDTQEIAADAPLSVTLGEWTLKEKHLLYKDGARLHCCAMHGSDLLVMGYSNGVFSLYEMPSATMLQTLSVSQHELRTTVINSSGEWIALASAKLGQLIVWEWQSETYVLKQQGHFYDLNVASYSPDGQLIVTGGDDAKVKLWSTTSGFCFVTFAEHEAPVTAVTFMAEGNAVISASLDGTVRAFDLTRYRNFRTMTTPKPVQFTSLAVDGGGEVVCAGALDPPEIYVWSLQTGKLLDVLAGHEGPISSLAFASDRPLLASASWDHTVRLWEPYNGTAPIETFTLNVDVLCVAFRPDGKELCAAALDGQLYFWDPEEGKLKGTIEGKRDVAGGRRSRDRVTAANATHNKHFTSVCYTADGECVIAGGRSKFVCIYQVSQRILLKKFQLSHNRSLDGILDKLNSKLLTESGPIDELNVSDSDSETEGLNQSSLPGASRGDMSKRQVKPEIRCKSVQFSSTGQEWAAASTEGLVIFSLDTNMVFDPVNIDETTTPRTILQEIEKHNYAMALLMALNLGEPELIVHSYRAVPPQDIPLTARSLPMMYIERLLKTISEQLESTPDLQYHLTWAKEILTSHNDRLRTFAPKYMSSFRALQKALSKQNKDLSKLCNENMYNLSFLVESKDTALFAPKEEKKEENGV